MKIRVKCFRRPKLNQNFKKSNSLSVSYSFSSNSVSVIVFHLVHMKYEYKAKTFINFSEEFKVSFYVLPTYILYNY